MRKGCILCLVTLAALNFNNSRFGDYLIECLEENLANYSSYQDRSTVGEKNFLDTLREAFTVRTTRPYYSARP